MQIIHSSKIQWNPGQGRLLQNWNERLSPRKLCLNQKSSSTSKINTKPLQTLTIWTGLTCKRSRDSKLWLSNSNLTIWGDRLPQGILSFSRCWMSLIALLPCSSITRLKTRERSGRKKRGGSNWSRNNSLSPDLIYLRTSLRIWNWLICMGKKIEWRSKNRSSLPGKKLKPVIS